MFRIITVVLTGLFVLGCSTQNLRVHSMINPKISIKDRNEIKLYLQPEKRSDHKEEFVEDLKTALADENFTIVGSPTDANYILTFKIKDSITYGRSHFTRREMGLTAADLLHDPEGFRGTYVKVRDSGYTSLSLTVWENVENYQKNNKSVWYGYMSTYTENFKKYPVYVINLLLEEYGHKIKYQKKFPKPKTDR